jgi:hypothetical protein
MSSRNRFYTDLDEILVALKTSIQHNISRHSTEGLYFNLFPASPSSPCLQSGMEPAVYRNISSSFRLFHLQWPRLYNLFPRYVYIYCFSVRFRHIVIHVFNNTFHKQCMKQVWVYFGIKCTTFRIFYIVKLGKNPTFQRNVSAQYSRPKNEPRKLIVSFGWFLAWHSFWPWRWKRHVLSKHYTVSEIHGVTTHKTIPFIFIALRTSNPDCLYYSFPVRFLCLRKFFFLVCVIIR